MLIFTQIGQADQYDPPRGASPIWPPTGGQNIFLKINVLFEFGTLKLVYMDIFSQIGGNLKGGIFAIFDGYFAPHGVNKIFPR